MTLAHTRSLDECERVIERGLSTFVAVGCALAEIRDERLYRQTHRNSQGPADAARRAGTTVEDYLSAVAS